MKYVNGMIMQTGNKIVKFYCVILVVFFCGVFTDIQGQQICWQEWHFNEGDTTGQWVNCQTGQALILTGKSTAAPSCSVGALLTVLREIREFLPQGENGIEYTGDMTFTYPIGSMELWIESDGRKWRQLPKSAGDRLRQRVQVQEADIAHQLRLAAILDKMDAILRECGKK